MFDLGMEVVPRRLMYDEETELHIVHVSGQEFRFSHIFVGKFSSGIRTMRLKHA